MFYPSSKAKIYKRVNKELLNLKVHSFSPNKKVKMLKSKLLRLHKSQNQVLLMMECLIRIICSSNPGTTKLSRVESRKLEITFNRQRNLKHTAI